MKYGKNMERNLSYAGGLVIVFDTQTNVKEFAVVLMFTIDSYQLGFSEASTARCKT
jgi:hypothetical protein